MPWQLLPAAEFKAHATLWDGLLERMRGSALLQSAYVHPMLAAHNNGRVQLALLKAGSRLNAMALVEPAGAGFWRAFHPPGMPLCAWLCPGADVAQAAHQLLTTLPGLNLGLHLGGLDPRMHVRSRSEAFEHSAKVAPFGIVPLAPAPTRSLETDTPKNSAPRESKKVLRRREKLEQESIHTHLQCSAHVDEVLPALKQFEALRRRGRSSHTGGHVVMNPAALSQTMVAFCSKGQGRIYRFYFGDRLVAMDLCIDNGTEIAVLATVYDESFRSASPFTLLRHDEIREWAADQQLQSMAMYGQVLRWHRRWRYESNWLYSRTVYRWPLLRTVHASWGAKRLNSWLPKAHRPEPNRPASELHQPQSAAEHTKEPVLG